MAKLKKKLVAAKKPVTKTTATKSVKPKLGKPAKAKPYVAPKPLPVAKPIASEPVVTETGGSPFKSVEGVIRPPRVRMAGPPSPYAFASRKVGSAFLVPAEVIDQSKYTKPEEGRKAQGEACARVANRLSGATRRFTKRNPEYKFTVFTVMNGKSLGFDHDIGVVVQRVG